MVSGFWNHMRVLIRMTTISILIRQYSQHVQHLSAKNKIMVMGHGNAHACKNYVCLQHHCDMFKTSLQNVCDVTAICL